MRQLAHRWLESVAQTPDGDFAASPAGLWLALAAVSVGARGKTATAFEGVLETGPEPAAAVAAAVRALEKTDALALATGVWSRSPLREEFRTALPDVGFGELDDASPTVIDAWVREATGGLVERLPVRIPEETRLLLVNALALKARWADPFDTANTRDRPFTDATGAVHQVPTMCKTFSAHSAWTVPESSGGLTRVVELRCATEGFTPAVVRFVIGSPGRTAPEVLPAAWAPTGLRARLDADRVRVLLPRLALRTTIEVTGHLPALGLDIATSDHADFSGLSPQALTIDQVVQEAVIKVAEEGIEAASATAVRMMYAGMVTSRPRVVEIAFDRPFGLVVLDSTGELPLFTAWQATEPRFPEG
ncbi:serpin family protein [Streptomyces silvisoli]|uniref:Serpin family protein n=1 Tax=Streptomyces silvisoli TaxID=3034235 RepID=A0ABT5ZFQ7_9ACTN|nr:serpin family protein [Streptomyces silvisoli]MDF3288659.1 serpin family protein [Streptomyces silvisoli]